MRRKWQGKTSSLVLSLTALAVVLGYAFPAFSAPEGWPLTFTHEKCTVTMYQPQLEEFKDDKLMVRAAVAVKPKTHKDPVFGVVWITARALTDRDTRMVNIDQPKVTEVKFHEAKPEQLEKLKKFLNDEIENRTHTISLDRLLAALELVEKERAGAQGLKNDPPKIIFVTHPAVLVPLDGEPKLLPIPDSKLMRLVNTAFLMVYDPVARTYYLKGGNTWLSTTDLMGPWQNVATLPEALKAMDADIAKKSGQTGKKVEAKAGKMPEIIVTTEPAELLATDGEPQYTPITGTGLLFVSNTESNIFMDTASQDYYVLLSGRWFRAKSLKDGPWSFVPSSKLPADFAKIPEKSTKGFVLASVTGTPQAKEAVLDSYIPQTAAINRKKAATQVKYDGPPKFQAIVDTDLQYAVNASQAVFKEGNKYYTINQGVWYEGDSPEGPWQVSLSPPKQVEKIPPSNPYYNVKYAKVYGATDDTVYVGYTPGYTGSYDQDGSMVYGTGYDYPAYASDNTYIPYPSTYGYAATYDPYQSSWGYQPGYYAPWNWLGTGLAAAVGAGVTWAGWNAWYNHYYPKNFYGNNWWGPGGFHYNNINVNHNWVNGRVWNPGGRWAGYYPGWKPGQRPGLQPGVKPAPYLAGANIYNRFGNQPFLASQVAKPGAWPVTGVQPIRPGVKPGEALKPGVGPGVTTQVLKSKPPPRTGQIGQNNVFGDKQGNVYRRGAQGQWQQRQGNQWSHVQPKQPEVLRGKAPKTPYQPQRPLPQTRPQVTQPKFDSGSLNREFQARQRGEVRTQQFQMRQQIQPRPQTSFSPSGGGGGVRGGGGGGGRRR